MPIAIYYITENLTFNMLITCCREGDMHALNANLTLLRQVFLFTEN